MRYDQQYLGDAFFRGDTTGTASNVKIEEFPDLGVTALIGYGHAVYATRDQKTREITYYQDWDGRSPSTSCQLTKLGLSPRATVIYTDRTADGRKSRGELRRADKQARRGEVAP